MGNWIFKATANEKNTNKFLQGLFCWAIFFFFVVVLLALTPHIIRWTFFWIGKAPPAFVNSDKVGEIGALGDFIGGVLNPILTFISFMALIVTIILQQRELSDARKEFKRTASAIEKENVESTFFKLLDRVDNALNRVEKHKDKGRTIVDQAFKTFARVFTGRGSAVELHVGNLKKSWELAYQNTNSFNYFSAIFSAAQVAIQADKTTPSLIEKNFYTELLKDQLTETDIWSFYYFLRIHKSEDELKILIPKFRVIWLKMDWTTLLESNDKEPLHLYLT